MPNIQQRLTEAVKNYLGTKNFKSMKTYPDPQVPGTYAIRAINKRGENVDFLYCGGEPIEDNLEEVEYNSWPPKSGNTSHLMMWGESIED
jgi:hypothetical protein